MSNKSPILSKKLQKETAVFFEYANAGRLSRNLRNLLISYLTLQRDGHSMNMDDLLTDMQNLFDLLDVAEERAIGNF